METNQKENKCGLCLKDVTEGTTCKSCQELQAVTKVVNKEKNNSEELKVELLRDISDKLDQVIKLLTPAKVVISNKTIIKD